MEILLLIIIPVIYIYWLYTTRKGIKIITTKQLKDILNDPSYYFVDVRTKNEYKARSIKQFKNIPLGSDFSKLPLDREIVVICQSGMRSAKACKELKKLGYENVTNVSGGMNSWKF